MKYRPRFFFNADAAILAGGASPAPVLAPEITSPVATPKVEPVNIPAHKGVISAAKSLGLALPGIQGPKEAGFDDPAIEMAAMEKSMGKKSEPTRGEDGKFTAADKTAVKATDKPKPKAAEKPVVPAKPEPVKPVAPVAKLKIGDKEMTPEEVTEHIASLEAKLKPAEPPKPEVPATQVADDEKKRDEEFYTTAASAYSPTEEEFDAILAGGPEAVKSFGKSLAKVELNARKWAQDQINPILDSFEKRIQPLLQHQQQIQQYTKETNFLAANPDIKAHAQGLTEKRTVEAALNQKRERIQRLISAGVADAGELSFAKDFDASTPEQLQEDIAHHVRQRLGIKPGETPLTPPAAVTPVAPPAPVSQPKPFNGDRPGGGHNAPVTESADARALREMTEAGR